MSAELLERLAALEAVDAADGVEGAAGKAGTSQSAVFTGTLGKCGGEKSLRIGEVGASGNSIVISAVDVGTVVVGTEGRSEKLGSSTGLPDGCLLSV